MAGRKKVTKKKAAKKTTTKKKAAITPADPPEVDDGLVAFQCPPHTGNIGIGREHGSKQYTPDANGVVRVEKRDAPNMIQSGFAAIQE